MRQLKWCVSKRRDTGETCFSLNTPGAHKHVSDQMRAHLRQFREVANQGTLVYLKDEKNAEAIVASAIKFAAGLGVTLVDKRLEKMQEEHNKSLELTQRITGDIPKKPRARNNTIKVTIRHGIVLLSITAATDEDEVGVREYITKNFYGCSRINACYMFILTRDNAAQLMELVNKYRAEHPRIRANVGPCYYVDLLLQTGNLDKFDNDTLSPIIDINLDY